MSFAREPLVAGLAVFAIEPRRSGFKGLGVNPRHGSTDVRRGGDKRHRWTSEETVKGNYVRLGEDTIV